MGLTIEIPSEMEHEAIAYAKMRGKTLEVILLENLKREIEEHRSRERRVKAFEALVDNLPRLEGEPYKFKRQDAYDGETQ